MRIYPRYRQKKHRLYVRAMKQLNECIERDSIRWDCSKNWIMITALGAFYGIDVCNPFVAEKSKKKRKAA